MHATDITPELMDISFIRISLLVFLISISSVLYSQTVLTINGQSYVNTETIWNGVEIPREVPTALTFSNNSISSVNNNNYMLRAGDENPQVTNNNLDGEVISGNKLVWNGSAETDGCHGIFVGYNKNFTVSYNYLDHVPYGVVAKSGSADGVNMTNTSGGISYNIIRNSYLGIRIKGMNGVCVYNNTFYDDMHSGFSGFIYITSNDGASIPAASAGTKIKNNIFYLKNPGVCIHAEAGSEQGFECDYNVYFCETGSPSFFYNGSTKTFTQWQALGYDTHSVIVNPGFINTSELVPSSRLDYGYDLGSLWNVGLSTGSVWGTSDPAKTTQNGTWQAGARLYGTETVTPEYIISEIQNATPSVLELTYNLSLAPVVPASSSFTVKVNSVTRAVTSVSIAGTRVFLTLSSAVIFGDVITVSYSVPVSNPLQTASGVQAPSLDTQAVINNCIDPSTLNKPPLISFLSPPSNSSFFLKDTIVFTTQASDPDGSIKNVQFFNGSTKLGEKTTAPYNYTWTGMNAGTYIITAVATDNLNATSSSSINVRVNPEAAIFVLYPNPNDGRFSINFVNPSVKKKSVTIFNYSGELVYTEMLSKDETYKDFDLQYIDPGFYILMVSDEEILFAEKFIKN